MMSMSQDVWPTPFDMNPPKEWMTELHPNFKPGDSPLITDEGRFNAWSHEWHRSHTTKFEQYRGAPSPTGYKLFHQGSTTTKEGIVLASGAVCLDGGHWANQPDMSIAAASRRTS